jgi:hypothetical protein
VIVVVVVVVVGKLPVVVVGVVVVVVVGVLVVDVNVIGVPFLKPVTTALASAPRNELKSLLILLITFVWPWLVVVLFSVVT